MSLGAAQIVSFLHMDGVESIVVLDATDADRAIARLRSCHDHVFVVDQSNGGSQGGRVTIGVSPRGALCLTEEFGYDPRSEHG